MIRVTTIYAASAGASARYYAGYLTQDTGELPGRWAGRQASAFGLAGEVSTEALESLLSGRHPITDQILGYALDARLLKRHQQTLGYVYQSVLRAELSARYGVAFDEIVNGQAEITGVPTELLHQFSKRAHVIAVEMDGRIADFIDRTGREPTDREYAAMEREAAADTRDHKSGLGVTDLRSRWSREAGSVGYDAHTLVESVQAAASEAAAAVPPVTVAQVLDELAERRSTWNRMDVLRTIAGRARPQPGRDAATWAPALEAGADVVLDTCINSIPPSVLSSDAGRIVGRC